jgi:hypothetical protein
MLEPQKEYRCTVEIDVYADTPEEAAAEAENLLRFAEMRWVVDVTDQDDVTTRVDLQYPNGEDDDDNDEEEHRA